LGGSWLCDDGLHPILMRVVTTFVTLICVTLSVLVSPAKAISGGSPINSGTSNVVAVVSTNSVCSGALLSPRVVVTAGHCVVNKDTGLLIKDLYVSPPGLPIFSSPTINVDDSWAPVDQVRISSNFENTSKVDPDDIAFLSLKKSLTLPFPVFIASPSFTEDLLARRSTVRIFGYGSTSNSSSSFGDVAQRAEVNLVQRLSSRPTEVWLSSESAGLCRGDSGGPVVVNNVSGTYVIGVLTGSLLDPTGSCARKQSDGKFYASATLLSGYANLAFEVAQSLTTLVESQIVTSTAKAKEYGDLLEQFLPKYEEQKALAESRSRTIGELNSTIGELNLKVEELQSRLSTLQTLECQRGKKRIQVTSSLKQCPMGFKPRR
jgi:hypothetical protein